MGRKGSRPNKLLDTVSPYLLQHAYNPVDWYPWGREALDRARSEDRPIFLSIGYSTCHWCHVMERESFEDEEVAKGLNEVFVCIKVDREERPDLDAVYMKACTLATGRGGWPLTVIMTPDLEPFFLGTYIPKKSRWGTIGLMDLIEHVRAKWSNNREDVLSTSAQVFDALGSILHKGPGADLDRSAIEECVGRLKGSYDEANGGFGGAPKFPSPHQGMLLLRYWRRTKDRRALDMVTGTLDHMMMGGIFDRIGGGFHRYSTDEAWRVPHFEKMLYDQAMMAMLLLEAYQSTGETRYAKAARSTMGYVLHDLSDGRGGFHSAEDADSEGEEGRFYLWSIDELQKVLNGDEMGVLLSEFDLRDEGNFTDIGAGTGPGRNILVSKGGDVEGMDAAGPDRIAIENRVDSILKKLRIVRDRRVRPDKDDKVLTDWNGMMVSALAKASRVLGERSFAERAMAAVTFILGTMRDGEGRLLHRYRNGRADIDGFLDDYAYVIQGMLDLYEATFDPKLLSEAIALNRIAMREFLDEEHGGFFQTSERSEKVLFRMKEAYDGAVPSGNSVQMMNLLRIARIGGGLDMIDAANAIGRSFSTEVMRSPTGFCYMLCALDRAIGPSSEIVISGDRGDPRTVQMIDHINSSFNPFVMTILNEGRALVGIVPEIQDYPMVEGRTTAYVCTGSRCDLPITDPETLKLTLDYY